MNYTDNLNNFLFLNKKSVIEWEYKKVLPFNGDYDSGDYVKNPPQITLTYNLHILKRTPKILKVCDTYSKYIYHLKIKRDEESEYVNFKDFKIYYNLIVQSNIGIVYQNGIKNKKLIKTKKTIQRRNKNN
jgi:hypothetical protein